MTDLSKTSHIYFLFNISDNKMRTVLQYVHEMSVQQRFPVLYLWFFIAYLCLRNILHILWFQSFLILPSFLVSTMCANCLWSVKNDIITYKTLTYFRSAQMPTTLSCPQLIGQDIMILLFLFHWCTLYMVQMISKLFRIQLHKQVTIHARN